MRKKIVAGNWKMNCLKEEAQLLTAEITGMMQTEVASSHNVILIPPFPFLNMVMQMTAGDARIKTGAQNCSDKNSGAFTGEVSAAMLKSVGVSFVLVGHSERRNYFNETDALLAEKIKQVLQHELTPVFCCGETLEQRNDGFHFETVKQQLGIGLFHLNEVEFSKVIIAYEPVWAIGTGVTATTDQAQEMHQYIRQLINEKYSLKTGEATTILYGGSCNDQNAKELFAMPDIDGGLIGGASLKSRSFVNIVKSFS